MEYRRIVYFCALLCIWNIPGVCNPYCDSLNENQMRIYENAQKGFHIPQCANMSLGKSLSDTTCHIAPRLSAFAFWLAHLNRDSAYITNRLAERYESLTSKQLHKIDYSLFKPAGEPNAPVTIAVYISIGCPFCKTVCNFLHDSVTVGSLKGKARVCVKLLSASDRDMTLLAAHGCGKFWQYMKLLATINQRLDMNVLLDAARKLDIPINAFTNYINNPSVRAHAVASRQEGLDNGVKATPTIFINGRLYYSYDIPMWIVDAVEYEYEQIRDNAGHK